MYRDAPSSTRSRTRTPLLTAGSATFWIRRQSAGLVKRGLSRAAGLFPATPGTPGWCVGDRSPGAGSGAGGGSSGADACMSSDSGSISSATAPVAVSGNSSCMAVCDSDCTAGSPTTILVIRMPDGAPRDVREPAKSRAAPARGLVAADEPMPRENTNAWIAIRRGHGDHDHPAAVPAPDIDARAIRCQWKHLVLLVLENNARTRPGTEPSALRLLCDVILSVARRLPGSLHVAGRRMGDLDCLRVRAGCRADDPAPTQLGQKNGMQIEATMARSRLSGPPTFTKSMKRYPPGE